MLKFNPDTCCYGYQHTSTAYSIKPTSYAGALDLRAQLIGSWKNCLKKHRQNALKYFYIQKFQRKGLTIAKIIK